MSEEQWSEARRRVMSFAARAVAAARAATAAVSEPVPDRHDADAPDAAHAPDDPNETIARLEQEIDAERARTEALLGTIKELEFKLEVLERSYAKQLGDAREHGNAVTQELTETRTQLADTTDELKRVTAIRDRLHDMISFDGRRVPPELRDREPSEEDTIARLLSVGGAASDAAAGDDGQSLEPADGEPKAEDLLAPELVFDPNEDRDDAEDRP